MATNGQLQMQLDAHIHRLELELCDLKQKRNTLSPISQLPPEILCKIFICSIPDIDYKDPTGRVRSKAVEISHVSHSWRAIAIADPELWAIFHIGLQTKGEALALALARAKDAPISLNICDLRSDRAQSFQLPEATISVLSKTIRQDPTRCRAFAFYLTRRTLQSLFKGVSGSFERLSSLKISIGVDGQEDITRQELFRRPFPRLRRIEAERPSLPASVLAQHPHLTYVDIRYLVPTESTIIDLLAFLKRSTALRSFQIRDIAQTFGPTPTFEVPSVISDKPTHLPDLEMFRLQCFCSQEPTLFEYILSSISVSLSSRIWLSSWTMSAKHLSCLVTSMYSQHPAPVKMSLKPDSKILYAWDDSSDCSLEAINPSSDRGSWINISQNIEGSCLVDFWEWGWSLNRLRVLAIGAFSTAEPEVATKFWPCLAESAVALEILQIAAKCVRGVAIHDFLKCIRGTELPGSGQQVAWPALRELHAPLPSNYNNDYERVRAGQATAPLHRQIEFALDLVDALKEREMARSKRCVVEPLAELRLTGHFKVQLEQDVASILSGGASKVTWSVKSS